MEKDREPYYLRERMRVASENLATLIAVAIGIGFLLGVTTNILAAYLLRSPHPWVWLVASAVLAIGLAALVVRWIYSRGYDIASDFEIVFPIRVDLVTPEALIVEPYPVTHTVHQVFHWATGQQEERTRFIHDWHQALERGKPPFQGFVRKCVQDILAYAVLDALREYSEQTSAPKVIYTKHRWASRRLAMRKIPFNDWPSALKDNICFKDLNKPVFQHIGIPRGLALGVGSYKEPDGSEKGEITLACKYGAVTFRFSPYPQRISSRSREGKILLKYSASSDQTELWLAKFSCHLSADFGGLAVFTEHFQKALLPWVEGLFRCVRSELDWRVCMERDLERMVVELREQLATFLDRRVASAAGLAQDPAGP